ncbi:hypothetical protein Poli38472_002155 [Pythium oligandrum]|uniref:WW domain-containing protein n=1 Tax=Pythium oligandrum TaxID=41045 RepID=A0A8K1CHM4_PYTOL|nr:hypothetical protein Poli38472_002155 [Pythium oligandrum]|eukprot:TMW63214.1 hypothetical protein Poli38472_002155 [Pythium oligandrum]
MARNDVNIPDSDEYSHQEQKRMAFQAMQQQLRELQVVEDEVEVNFKAKEHGQHDLDGREAEREGKRLEALEQVKRMQQQTAERKKEATENELMKREDHYYAEKILREKQREAERLKQLKKTDPIEEQKKRIERMKQADAERKRVELALEAMRNEDLLARQMRFRDAEIRKMDVQREWKTRKDMQDEETDSRLRWRLIEQARLKQEEDERKRQRAEERRQRREQEKQQRAELAAWIECYDSNGYIYYYNQLTGASQWENPYTSTPT